MKELNKFSPEVRERAVRMVQEQQSKYASLWAAVESIAPKIGCVPSTLLDWVKAQQCWRRPKTEPLLRVVPTQN